MIRRVLPELAACGLDHMVVKGPSVAHAIYPNPVLRVFNDLDVIVRERDWALAHEILLDMGFQSQKKLSESPPKLIPQATLFHQEYDHEEMPFRVEVHYDDVLNTGLVARDVEGFWERSIRIDIGGFDVKTLSLEDQLVYLCAHLHFHGYTRLCWFSDLAFLLRDRGASMCWSTVVETVEREEAQVATYYTLRFLGALLSVSAPNDVLAKLRPDPFRRRLHEWFLPSHRVLSMQPMWRPYFSFYHTPFFRRLVPDLLIMGNRQEKLHYIGRLLTPPRAWLVHYYALDGTHAVWPHYLLHPLKLLYHIIEEVI